ncbi:Flavin monooxygenase-like protein [Metarhizium brunneum]
MATNNIRSATVDSAAAEEYSEYTQERPKGTVWTSGCRSWYKNIARKGR